jgi:NAD(P)-dependent dehydrogenase (short-subunit alcohol dehydrogenase family)
MGEISEIVDGILYLEAAKFVTGEILHVDGGQSAGQGPGGGLDPRPR